MKRIIVIIMILLLPLAMAAQVKVACIGDSITYGAGVEDRENNSYPSVLQNLLGTDYKVANFGRSGTTLLRRGHRPYMDQKEFRDAMEYKADIAVIHLGINDTDPRDWPDYRDDFVSDYLALIDSLRSVNPSVRIIMARLTPITYKHARFQSGTKQWHGEITEHIELVAKVAGVELIDFHEPLHSRYNLIPDAVHPNAEGARILAQIVFSGITGNYGGLRMPQTYSDNMVLQRGVSLRIAGHADAGEKVKVSLGCHVCKTVADNRGEWEVVFEPLKAARGLTLTIASGGMKLKYENVAVGEVWLCSGQSNMQFMLRESSDMPSSDSLSCDDIRLFDMKGRWNTNNRQWSESVADSVMRLEFFKPASWELCSPETAKDFSAVGYHFAKMLQDSLKVPVGVICNAVGGATTESWIDRETIETRFPAILNDWLKNDFIQGWARKRAAKNMGTVKEGAVRHPYEPCYLFESGIKPLESYPVRGVIWYQGESNAHNFTVHEKLFGLLVDSWRENWNEASMPFYFVQLSGINRPSWGWFRDSQRRLLDKVPYSGMAVSYDRGDSLDVHPKRKADVGRRLARLALYKDYGFEIVPSGPLFETARRNRNSAIVSFAFSDGLETSDGQAVRGFELAGEDEIFYPASAEISSDKVTVVSDRVSHTVYLRYAWAPYTTANLVNAEGLPASTFRAEVTY